ncbi:MAG: 2-polyprenyl-3-methyl-6-methoxy-1,4-benzoquinone monooxygenase [Gammaproteobacteria bacterium]
MDFAKKMGAAFAKGARAILTPTVAKRESPADDAADGEMSPQERKHSAALMRVNHCGEVCAQALYQGQALFARDDKIAEALQEAADEEIDHLAWTSSRIRELGGRMSILNPLWYGGAFAIGAAAAVISDKVSLGFVAETERQVSQHLQSHLNELPPQDAKSRAIVEQMDTDEQQHATSAVEMGAAELPQAAKSIMRMAGKVMTRTSYHL